MAFTKVSLVLVLCLLGFCSETVKSQNCSCAPNLCCSQYGYCGTSDAYCGTGCRSGPCKVSGAPSSGGSVSSIVKQGFFDYIINQADRSCTGKRFYTYDSFVKASNSFPNFANSVTRRELAAMFAHFTHETEHFCYVEEINGATRNYCDRDNKQYPCSRNKGYFGRGPIQLSWNFNYGACGQSLGLDLLRQPELVSSNPTVAFKTALWFWMNNVRPVLNQGFGATIKAINGMECNGKNSGAVNSRISYYKDYCRQLGVDPGPNLSQWGYCGQTDDYCGEGCKEGPCQGGGAVSKTGGDGDAVSLEGMVTPSFFRSILNQARDGCVGKGFYSHNAFIAASNYYSSFSSSISKREIAAF